jgi:phospholipid transport system substrate-binding protein
MDLKTKIKTPVFFAMVITIMLLGIPQLNAKSENQEDIVSGFHEALLKSMQSSGELNYQERYDQLKDEVEQRFDLEYMSKVVSGRHWRKASEGTKENFVRTFSKLTISNYTSRFDSFSGEQFETIGMIDGPKDSKIIRTNLIKSNGEKISLNYLVKESDDKWKIIDIFLEGKISELAIKKSEYSSVLKNQGFENLILAIEKKIRMIEEREKNH